VLSYVCNIICTHWVQVTQRSLILFDKITYNNIINQTSVVYSIRPLKQTYWHRGKWNNELLKKRLTSHIQYCKQVCYIVPYFDVYSSDVILFFTAKHLRAFWQWRFRFSGSHSRNATYWSFSTGLHWRTYFLHIAHNNTKILQHRLWQYAIK